MTILWGAMLLLAITAVPANASPCVTASPTCFQPRFIRTGGEPVPNPPLTVEVTDTDDVLGVPDVQIEMNALFGTGSAELISDIVMNVDPRITPGALTFTQTLGATTRSLVVGVQNAQDLAPETGFDVSFGWTTSNSNGGAGRFNESDVMKFTVSCAGDPDCGGFSATAFNFLTAGGFRIGAHIQGMPSGPCFEFDVPTGTSGCTSGKVFGTGVFGTGSTAVPGPATLLLVGAGLLGLGVVPRRSAR